MTQLELNTIREPERSLPIGAERDVVVVGGGPAGLTAALAAADGGRSVTLVEGRSFVGGNLAIGLPVLGFLSQRGVPIIAGLAEEFIARLRSRGAASGHRPCPLHMSLTLVDPEAVKTVALEMLAERGVEVLLYTTFAGVAMRENRIRAIIMESKAGREAIAARVVVDCTGDGDVAYRSGVPCEKGDAHGGMQPPTLMFRLDGVDVDRLRASLRDNPDRFRSDVIPPDYFGRNDRFIVVGLRRLIEEARAAGLSIPTERTILITGLRQGEVWVNMTRVKGIDGTNPRSLTAGEIESRRQIDGICRYLVAYVPGFENACFTVAAPFLGIRETRRIVGQYVMTADDILACRQFEDAVALASYPIDLHRPDDDDCTLQWCGDCYSIPYRSLVPRGVDNLLVAGRCISTTHEAMAAIRVMSTCMATGEAAGCAARTAVETRVSPAQIDVGKLRVDLAARGACVTPPS